MEGFQSQSICHHLMKCWSATAEHSQKPRRNLIFLANSGVVRSYIATWAGWIETITICSHVVRNWTSISFKYNPSCWATTNPLLPPAGRQRYTTCVSKCGDLHFREQLSLLQLILFFLLQLSHVTFLYQEQLLSDLVINALHLGTNTPPHVRASFRTLPTDHTNATITWVDTKLNTYSLEYPRATLVCFVHFDPLVGHGLAEADLPKGQFLDGDKDTIDSMLFLVFVQAIFRLTKKTFNGMDWNRFIHFHH